MTTFVYYLSRRKPTRLFAKACVQLAVGLAVLAAVAVAPVRAQITTPLEHFGFNIGDDYHLATYTQFESYVRKLADESPRSKLLACVRPETDVYHRYPRPTAGQCSPSRL